MPGARPRAGARRAMCSRRMSAWEGMARRYGGDVSDLGVTPGLGRWPCVLSPRAGSTPFPEHNIRSERHQCSDAGIDPPVDRRPNDATVEPGEQSDAIVDGRRRHRLGDPPVRLVAIGVRCRSVAQVAERLDAPQGGRTWRSATDGAIRARLCAGEAHRHTAVSPVLARSRGGWSAAAEPGSGDPRRQPRLVLRFRRADHDGPPNAQLRRQGRIPRELEDAAFVAGVRHDSRRSQRRAPRRGRPEGRRRGVAVREDVRDLPRRHPVRRRRPARRPHRRGLPRDGHGRTDPACGHRRDGPHPAAGHQGPAPVPTGHGSVRQPDRPSGLRRQPPPPSTADHHRRDDCDPSSLGPDASRAGDSVNGAEAEINDRGGSRGVEAERGVCWLLDAAARLVPGEAPALVDAVRHVLGAQAGRVLVADYSLRRLQQVDVAGPVGTPHLMAGTIAGRAFTSGEVTVSGGHPTVVSIPLVDGTDRIGLLELDYDAWDGGLPAGWERVVAVFVLVLIAESRYSDLWVRARRSEPLSAAAEVQWDLLPPLSCSTDQVAVGGILEPAYEIGGDSFDYAINGARLEFAIVDAIGHGMSAVLMSAAAINSLRSARRTGVDLVDAFCEADQ